MKTLLFIGIIIIFMMYAMPYIISKFIGYSVYKNENEKLLQNLNEKYNKNVIRGKNGRFKSKNEIN